MRYDSSLTLRAARLRYFEANGFGDGGYGDPWVKLKAGPLTIYFPNTPGRVRGVKLHDLHHVLTEYDTTWTGEAEIGMWELATGCGHHYAVWVLNLNAAAIGLFLNPLKVFAAFRRAQGTACLYAGEFHEDLLERTVGGLRAELHLEQPPAQASLALLGRFSAWSVAAIATLLAPGVILVAAIAAVLRFVVS